MKNTSKKQGGNIAMALALGATAGTCTAQSQVQIYGTVDVAAGRLSNQTPGAPTTPVTRVNGVFNGGLQTSYIGFRGTEDLGGGLSARFVLESFIRVDTGQSGRFDSSPGSAADPFFARNAYVALGSRFGEVRLGSIGTPLWLALIQTSAMGANSTFSPSFRQLYNGGTRGRSVLDTAMPNSIAYQMPTLGGVSALAAVQAGEGRGSRYNYSANIVYRNDALVLGGAVQSARHAPTPAVGGSADQDIALIGASYNIGPARVFAQYATVDNAADKSRLPYLGLAVPIGPGLLQVSTGQDRNKLDATGVTTKRTTTSLGYIYGLSKRTDVYTFAMTEKFPVVGPAENSGESFVVGVSHRF